MNRLLLVSIVASGVLLVAVFYMIRTRRLHERFALIWLAGALVIAVLAVWETGLNTLATWAGIAYPPNFLFVAAGALVLWILLHGSVVMTKLLRQNTTLAQRVAMLEAELGANRKANNDVPRPGYPDQSPPADHVG